MPVQIDEVVSEVTTEPEVPAAAPAQVPEWREMERVRGAGAHLRCDRFRTAAEGYDD